MLTHQEMEKFIEAFNEVAEGQGKGTLYQILQRVPPNQSGVRTSGENGTRQGWQTAASQVQRHTKTRYGKAGAWQKAMLPRPSS